MGKAKKHGIWDEARKVLNFLRNNEATEQEFYFLGSTLTITKLSNYKYFESNKSKKLVEVAPGFRFLKYCKYFCSKKFVERELAALHADAVENYYEALATGSKKEQFIAKYMIYIWMLGAIAGGLITSIAGFLLKKNSIN